MPEHEQSGWGTGGGRGEGASPFGWDGFGWSGGGNVAGTGSAKDHARAVWSRSVHVGRSAWTAPTLGQRIAGVFMLAFVVGIALLIIVPAVVIGIVVILLAALYAFIRSAFRSMSEGAKSHGSGGRKNVRVMGKSGE